MKIGFCGTMSVGKTTLVNALKELPEFKDYHFATERSKYLRDLGIPLNTDSTILGQTIFLAERCSELIRENIITDRTIYDVMAFTFSANSISDVEKREFANLLSRFTREYDIVIYVSPEGVEIEDNGIRTIDAKYRDSIDKAIKLMLDEWPPNKLIEIKGTTEERIETIKGALFS